MTYPFVASRYRGPVREGPTLGILYHMAEGGNTVHYLASNPLRGVSVHFVIEYTGRIVQMLNWNERAATLNPRVVASDKPYYGHSHLVDVLGDWWKNPNHALIQVEMEGFAQTGPNAKQAAAAVELTADAIKHYPSIRGALGHADQTDEKFCPGTTPEMKAVFASIGGHGLWAKGEPVGPEVRNLVSFIGTATVKGDGHGAILANDGSVFPLPNGASKEVVAKGNLVTPWPNHADTTVYLVGSEPAYLLAEDVVIVATPPVNCDDKVAAELERAAVRAHDAVLAA